MGAFSATIAGYYAFRRERAVSYSSAIMMRANYATSQPRARGPREAFLLSSLAMGKSAITFPPANLIASLANGKRPMTPKAPARKRGR